MLHNFTQGLLISGALLLAGCSPSPSHLGQPAPELPVGAWFNTGGVDPSLANLRGQAFLIEFWATW